MCDPGKQRQAWATCPRASPSSLQHHSPATPVASGWLFLLFQSARFLYCAPPASLPTFTCQRDFIPLCRGSERHGGNDHQHREAGTKQLKAARAGLQLPSLTGTDVSQAPPPPPQYGISHPAVAPTTHPSQPRLPHSRRELLRAGCSAVISLQVCTSCLEVAAGAGPGKPRWL